MNTSTNYAALFYSETDNDIEVLEKNVHDFPASSVARFLLLYHHKKNNNPAFEDLAKQTAIFLNNPYWSEYQLWQIDNPTENNLQKINEENKENSLPEIKEEEELPASVKEDPLAASAGQEIIEVPSSQLVPVDEENKDDSFPEIQEEEASAKEDRVTASAGQEIIEVPSSQLVPVDEENKDDSFPEIQEEEASVKDHVTASAGQEIIEVPSSELVPVDEENKDALLKNIDPAKEAEKKSLTEDEQIIFEENHDFSKEENQFEDESVLDIKIPDEDINSSKENLIPDEDNYETIAFEPLHTVDYFASQGIKIDEEALANDHLGKQVKSFTAWLKSMKKLHPGQMPEQNEVIEKIIQSSSEASNNDAHVLTEAMAEVLIKQGKREKAMEMYEKLSLINPSKSAYFAAKIENLKIV